MSLRIDQQCHGYQSGHQLLGGSIKLSRDDQDVVDRLSDISGPLRPGEQFLPYLTCYSLPGGSHYVVARTWQDLVAKRAGCVLTRSIFIQSADWLNLADIPSLLELLRPVERAALSIDPISFTPVRAPIPPVDVLQGVELVESLFLEDRQPVVVFGGKSAELMIVRLLTAFWPALRRNFAACSFALAPRSVSGRPFDLMFTSPDTRSRFSKWNGRRIDGTTERLTDGRHRWSLATAKLVFQDPQPNLAKIDSLGILRDDSNGDETRLRLALLWNDLMEQSKNSPRAVLGMLDILQSQGERIFIEGPKLSTLLANSVNLSDELPVPERLEFLLALTGKFRTANIPLRLSIKIFELLCKTASEQPAAALTFLTSAEAILSSIPMLVIAALGEGFAMSPRSVAVKLQWETLSDEALLKLFATSSSFVSLILDIDKDKASSAWRYRIPNVLSFPELKLKKKAERRLLRSLSSPDEVPILAACLSDGDSTEIEKAVRVLWKSTQLSVSAFDQVFLNNVPSVGALTALRTLILSLPETANTDRFLKATLNPQVDDLRWLMSKAKVGCDRRKSLVSWLLEQAARNTVQSIARDTRLATSVLEVLLPSSRSSELTDRIAWLLTDSEIPGDRLLGYVHELISDVSRDARRPLLVATVGRALSSASHSSSASLLQLISQDDFDMSTDHLVANAFNSQAATFRLNDNLVLFNRSPHKVRRGILQYIDNISERLVHLSIRDLASDGIAAWSQLLADAGDINHTGQVRAASVVLSYAFSQPDRHVSPLIVTAFPIVYRALQSDREESGLFSLFFPDWDRCKAVRKDLARAFVHSQWPPKDLLVAARAAGDVVRILKAVLKEDSGAKFLQVLQTTAGHDSELQVILGGTIVDE
jgi:hypothetical protein